MARSLAKKQGTTRESDLSAEFEAAELITLGAVYEQAPRFAGGAYSPFLKKLDRFSERPLASSLREREAYASRLAGDRCKREAHHRRSHRTRLQVSISAQLRRRPHQPRRFHKVKKGDAKPPMPIAEALTRMAAAAKKFDVKSVSNAQIAWVAVGAGASE